MAGASVIWYARSTSERSATLAAFTSPDFPDGAVVDAAVLSGTDLSSVPAL